VPDWHQLTAREHVAVANPSADEPSAEATSTLVERIASARAQFEVLLAEPPPRILVYAVLAATLFGKSNLRCSPRRVRQLTRNLLGLAALHHGHLTADLALLGLTWSLPHRAWGAEVKPGALRAVHRTAWDSAFDKGEEAWLNQVLIEPKLHLRVRQILGTAPSPDLAGIATIQCLNQLAEPDSTLFAFALYPAALEGRLNLSREGVQALAKKCHHLVDVEGEIGFRKGKRPQSLHRRVPDIEAALQKFRAGRKRRAEQLFYGVLLQGDLPVELEPMERAFHSCILEVRKSLRKVAA